MIQTKHKKLIFAICGISALALISWIVLLCFVFRRPTKVTNQGEKPKEIIDENAVWVLTSEDHGNWKYDDFEYDSTGRLIHAEENSEVSEKWKLEYNLEYYYEGDVPVTKLTIIENYHGIERRDEYEYYPSGRIRKHTAYYGESNSPHYTDIYADTRIRCSLKSVNYANDGSVIQEYRFEPDPNGYVISCEKIDYTEKTPEWTLIKKSELDAKGRVVKLYAYEKEKWWLDKEMEYFDDGGMSLRVYDNGYLKAETRLDAEGRTVEYTDYDYWSADEPVVHWRTVYEYTKTEQGYRKKITEGHLESGVSTYVTVEEYTTDDRLISSEAYDSKGNITKYGKYVYDENGKPLKDIESRDGVTFSEWVYTYDRYGNLISEGRPGETEYTYEYKPIHLSEEQIAENAKFYMDLPYKMEKIGNKRW